MTFITAGEVSKRIVSERRQWEGMGRVKLQLRNEVTRLVSSKLELSMYF